jgi:pimeloyl-ACP methyl ester carboxylesterase
MPLVDIAGARLEYDWIAPARAGEPTLVFLHEGLGSVSLWRDFPRALATWTGCGALVYSRLGHGRSDPFRAARTPRFMHDEALVTLPAVLRQFSIEDAILVGHSDGGSIAIIYAGSGLGPVRGLLLEAPHVFVEDLSVASIARVRVLYESSDLAARLARHHGTNTDTMFRGWNDVWLLPEFRDWNLEAFLPSIQAPILLIQGENDEYGTRRQVEAIAAQAGGSVSTLLLADCGHAPHVDRSNEVLEAMAAFIDELTDPGIRT